MGGTGKLGRFDEPMTARQILFSFRGRIPRKTFWTWGVAVMMAASVYVSLLLGIAGMSDRQSAYVSYAVFLWPVLAIFAKRLHDRDRSGWWAPLIFVPVLGMLWALIEGGCLRGSRGPNRFGDDLTARF